MIQQLHLGEIMEDVLHHVVEEQNIEQDIYIVHIMDNTVEPQPEVHHVIHMDAVIAHMLEDGLDMVDVQQHVVAEQNHNTDIIIQVIMVDGVGQNMIMLHVIPKDAAIVLGAAAGAAGAVALHLVAEERNTAIKKDTQVTIMDGVGQNRPHNHVILIHVVQSAGGMEHIAGTMVEQMVELTIAEDYIHVKMPQVQTV